MSGTPAFLSLPGVLGAYGSTPDSAALSITGDIDIRVLFVPGQALPSANWFLVSKAITSGQYAYDLFIDTAGKLNFRSANDGVTLVNGVSSVAAGLVAGSVILLRAARRASDGRVQFFTDVVWSSGAQLGSNRTTAVGSMVDGTDSLSMGAQPNGAAPTSGRLLRAQIRNNIADDGTGIVFDADFTIQTPGALTFTESSSNLATVTLNGKADIVFRDPMPANYQYVQAGDGMSVSEGIR